MDDSNSSNSNNSNNSNNNGGNGGGGNNNLNSLKLKTDVSNFNLYGIYTIDHTQMKIQGLCIFIDCIELGDEY